MKKYFLFSLLLGIIASSACASHTTTVGTATATISSPPTKQILPTLTSESTPEPYVIVDVPMYVRNGPGTEFDVIGQIESQKKYLVIGKHVDWWLVNLGNNQSGWVYAPGNVTRFFGNADTVPDIASSPTPTPEIISACTPADKTETQSEGLKKARNAV